MRKSKQREIQSRKTGCASAKVLVSCDGSRKIQFLPCPLGATAFISPSSHCSPRVHHFGIKQRAKSAVALELDLKLPES